MAGFSPKTSTPSGRPASRTRCGSTLLDHYLLTHHTGREHLVGPEHKPKVFRTAGWVSPTVLIRGRIAGIWDLSKGLVTVTGFA